MQAIHVQNPGPKSSLEIRETPTPEPAADELLVKVEATAVNRADLLQRKGNYPSPEGAPDILGLETAGIVEKTGANVTAFSEGDFVFGLLPGGGYAEYCTMPEKIALPIPQNLSFTEAAAIPETFLTAFQALKWIGDLKRGETVLIHAGGSGVGTAAIQLARHLVDARIATTAGKKHKLETCRSLGADLAINYKKKNFAKQIKKSFGEESVHVIIDFIGAPYWEDNIDVFATDGRLVYLSYLGGHTIDHMSIAPILAKRLQIMGSTLRSRSISYKMRLTQDFWSHTEGLFEDGTIAPVIDSVFDWSEAEEAHQHMQDDHNTGKIVLTGM